MTVGGKTRFRSFKATHNRGRVRRNALKSSLTGSRVRNGRSGYYSATLTAKELRSIGNWSGAAQRTTDNHNIAVFQVFLVFTDQSPLIPEIPISCSAIRIPRKA